MVDCPILDVFGDNKERINVARGEGSLKNKACNTSQAAGTTVWPVICAACAGHELQHVIVRGAGLPISERALYNL